jgi:hypothetical protein
MPKYVPYLYLARVPILTGLLLIALAPISLFSGVQSLFRGLFDLNPWGAFFVALGSMLSAWTVMITLWLVAAYAPLRFGVESIGTKFPPRRNATILFSFLAVPLWIGMFYESANRLVLIPGLLAGVIVAVAILIVVNNVSQSGKFKQGVTVPESLRPRVKTGAGYVSESDPDAFYLLKGHGLAAGMFFASVGIYGLVGLLKFFLPGEHAAAPSLAYVLLLVMVACWGLSGGAFFLDRYRVPILLPLGLWWLITSQVFPSDHYYLVQDGVSQVTPIPPGELIQKGTGRAIVVAAQGGGIQAAGWTAKVLEGLEQKCADAKMGACAADHKLFGKSIRLISSVSGGSTGAMYFVNKYDPQNGGLSGKPGTAFEEATKSSLDDVAWGLVYPDFFRTLVPIPWRFDRGWALEQAWEGNRAEGQLSLKRNFSEWRGPAREGKIPGLIFNSTIVETGQRLLLATVGIDTGGQTAKTFQQLGQNGSLYTNKDLSIPTAARLSASFTYVTPVSRSDGDVSHIADGGYYDNYGMSTLIQWLGQALAGSAVKDVLVLEIRGFPPNAQEDQPRRGWLYQSIAPLSALLNVRNAGQYAHNRDELVLLQKAAEGRAKIYTSVFQFCGGSPPLSWHLRKSEIEELNRPWNPNARDQAERMRIDMEWARVERFLNGASLEADMPEPPLESLCSAAAK